MMQPQFKTFQEFLYMDNYGPYVFTAFGIAVICKMILLFLAIKSEKKAQKQSQILEAILNEKN